MTGGDLLADVLVRHGVRSLFTLCGGHISPILVSAKARGIRVVDTRHEATAVFAADATARLTGVPGVAAVTAGPGVVPPGCDPLLLPRLAAPRGLLRLAWQLSP